MFSDAAGDALALQNAAAFFILNNHRESLHCSTLLRCPRRVMELVDGRTKQRFGNGWSESATSPATQNDVGYREPVNLRKV